MTCPTLLLAPHPQINKELSHAATPDMERLAWKCRQSGCLGPIPCPSSCLRAFRKLFKGGQARLPGLLLRCMGGYCCWPPWRCNHRANLATSTRPLGGPSIKDQLDKLKKLREAAMLSTTCSSSEPSPEVHRHAEASAPFFVPPKTPSVDHLSHESVQPRGTSTHTVPPFGSLGDQDAAVKAHGSKQHTAGNAGQGLVRLRTVDLLQRLRQLQREGSRIVSSLPA
jgi:hypothetical protein